MKSIEDVNNHKIIPRNENMRGKDVFHVNFAVAQCQSLLNKLVNKEKSVIGFVIIILIYFSHI